MSDIVEEQSDDQSGVTSGVEKASYGSYFAGQNIFYALIFMFLVTFLTDVGIPAKIVAVIVLVVKVWDAVNDPIFGGLIDKIRFRKGRFVPWLRISLVGVPIVTILLFAIPSGLSLGSKIVWSVIAYVLWDTAYTICDVPIFGLVTTMTADLGDRTKLISLGRLAANIAMAAVIMALPLFRQAVGGWLPMVVILSVAGGLLMIPICFTAKERVIPHQEAESVGLRQLGRFLIGNKYLLIFYAAMIISQSFAVLNALNMYVVRYNLGDERWLTLVAAISLVPIVVAALLMPSIVKRVDKFTLYFWSSVGSVIIALVAYFVGYHNFTALMVLLAIRSVIAA
ncbi:MAG: MFS transporter, partial [Propionibacteriaceae bacterium]|nr:MFS transporter [Propionibacteriaceae bacterium]